MLSVSCWRVLLLCMRAQLFLTLCDPMDCSLPGSSVCGIFQARILEWVAFTSSKGSSYCCLSLQIASSSHFPTLNPRRSAVAIKVSIVVKRVDPGPGSSSISSTPTNKQKIWVFSTKWNIFSCPQRCDSAIKESMVKYPGFKIEEEMEGRLQKEQHGLISW